MVGSTAAWRQLLQRAVRLHQAGQLGEAINLYRDVLAQNSENTDALHLLGVALEQAGLPAQGRPFIELAIRHAPEIAAYHNSLGNILRGLGDAKAARHAYRAALDRDPAFAEAHNNLGLLDQKDKEWSAAAAHFRAALAADPDFVAARFNLALSEWMAGEQQTALSAFSEILNAAPGYAASLANLVKAALGAKDMSGARRLFNLLEEKAILPAGERHFLKGGLALAEHGAADAEQEFRAALAFDPQHGDALALLAKLLLERHAEAEAIPFLERLLAQRPQDMATLAALGHALNHTGAHERAVLALQQVVASQPDDLGALAKLAQSLGKIDRLDEACDTYRQVIAAKPEEPSGYANLAGLELRRGNLQAASEAAEAALQRDPNNTVAIGNLANIRGVQRQFEAAEALYRQLLALQPEDADTHNNLGMMLLRLERYDEAWPHFAWRRQSGGWTSPDCSRGLPCWDGSDPSPGRVLIWREQGVGDEILFSSLLPELAAAGTNIVLATEKRLVPLFARSFPDIQVVDNALDLDMDTLRLTCQKPLADIAAHCRPDKESFKRQPRRFLVPDADRVGILRARYRGLGIGKLVGVSWNSRNPRTGRHKSITLQDMLPLFQQPDATFISLQYGKAAADTEAFRAETGIDIYRDPEIDPLTDIDGQAAQIAALDMVVTVSTASAHIAGALGVPTLILLPEDWGQLWYWGAAGERTPWYPSVRLCCGAPDRSGNDVVQRALPMFRAMLSRSKDARL